MIDVQEAKRQLEQQPVGILSNMSARMKPIESVTGSLITYHLSPEVCASILQLHPALRDQYRALVPHHLSAEDFWLTTIHVRMS